MIIPPLCRSSFHGHGINLTQWLVRCSIATIVCLAGCGGHDNSSTATTSLSPNIKLACDDSIKTGFKPDANTNVLLVKAYKKGDPLVLSESVTTQTPVAANDLCMVKLNVGPGNAGPADAPSTSQGIGIEIWLPAPENWNQRIHVLGSGGWGGGMESSTTAVQNQLNASGSPAAVAGIEGAVSAISDTGHTDMLHGGSFAMNPDGTINATGWQDFSTKSVHEMAVLTKALATSYYGAAPKYSYFDGGSMGGRQALTYPQVYPTDFDGILVEFPAINWTRFITADLYPWTVIQQDLGGKPMSTGQLDLASNAAISTCDMVGGKHLGFLLDPSQCRYDPTKDANVLCKGVNGNGAVVGTNATASCLSLAQATAINKIWYGMTSDGSVPDPAVDNGWDTGLSGTRRWYGTARGASLYGPNFAPGGALGASPNGPFSIATDEVALELQDPTIAGPTFINATGNGASNWTTLSYVQLSNAYDRGVALQNNFDNIDTNNPDLSTFNARGGKIIQVHGLADEAIMPQGSMDYYNQVAAKMGGVSTVQNFYRLYMLPGVGHGNICQGVGFVCNSYTNSYTNGTSNPNANGPVPDRSQIFSSLESWVEKGVAPDTISATSPLPSNGMSIPLCAYPKKTMYARGDPSQASSYTCQ